jgi:hypothetical protein
VRKEYTNASTDFVAVRDAYSKMTAIGKDPSPAGDLGLIFNYMKMLDPSSTVRESEAAAVAASGSFGERAQAWGQQILTGERLTPAMRSDVLSQSANTMQAQLDHQLRAEQEFGDLGERYGIPRRDVTPDLIGDIRKGVPKVERMAEGPAAQAGKGLLEQGLEMGRQALGIGGAAVEGAAGQAPRAAAAVGDWSQATLDQLLATDITTLSAEARAALDRRLAELGY